MAFTPKKTKDKQPATYKTIYLSAKLVEQINTIARTYDTSFNNVVVSMVEQCLEDADDPM